MPQLLVNHSLDSLAAGVTQQFQEGRHESQVEEMLNCLPSMTRGVLRRNPIYKHTLLGCGNIANAFTYSYDRGVGTEQYIIVLPGDSLGSWYVYNVNDVTKTWTGTNNYFKVPAGSKAKDVFEAITIGDYTFIVNNTVTVAQSSGNNALPTANYSSWAFYWIKMTTQVVIAQETVSPNTGSLLVGYTYGLTSTSDIQRIVIATKDTRPSTTTDPDVLTAYKIATKMASYEAAWTADSNSAFVYSTTATKWNWEDSNGSLASLGVWKTVSSDTELPASLPAPLDGFIVRVTGGSSISEDDYYLQYSNTDKTWNECAEPGIKLGVDPATMPHVIYGLGTPATRTFVANTYQTVTTDGTALTGVSAWGNRTVGDMTTNADPSFVGKTITNIFFYRNRLGFISGDSIVLSRTNELGNFYLSTIQTTLADGPIDLTVATTDVVSLRHVVPTEDALIVFADEAQFALTSGNQVLGANTATITVLANYNYAPNMDAKALGNRIYFGSISGGYAQIYSMAINTGDLSRTTEAETMTMHIPSYINKGIDRLVGHDVLGQMFIHSENIPNILYVVSSAGTSQEKLQQAFHTWEFEENIVGIHTINNELYLVFEAGSLAVISLEIPGDITTTSYLDKRANDTFASYVSGLWFSQFYYRDARKRGSARGRFQLKTMLYSLNKASRYQTVIRNNTLTKTDAQTSCFGPIWGDLLLWEDATVWIDTHPDYDRVYKDDKKITVMSSAGNVSIKFTNNPDVPAEGFEVSTVNVEALFYQRSSRT